MTIAQSERTAAGARLVDDGPHACFTVHDVPAIGSLEPGPDQDGGYACFAVDTMRSGADGPEEDGGHPCFAAGATTTVSAVDRDLLHRLEA